MAELTDRQIKILKSIIEEYMESAEPIGSGTLEKKYELGVSPATVRNEMAALTKMKYLHQPHTSAGRIPSKEAFKFYVNQLMEEKKLSVADEVAAKEKVWDSRFDFDKLMHEATKALAERSRTLAVAATKKGDVYHAGYANILEMPEFYDIDVTRAILSMLDETNRLLNLFSHSFGEEQIHLLLGDELGYDFLEPCGMIFVKFDAGPEKSGSLGVIGPMRLDYPRVIPMVKYFGNLLEEVLKEV
ncbi:MAG TPA: hypothetical protein VMY36_02530 [Patescibacteria group bacterium]|nr:hypothetical protein [Patescibacteria group bacterium]